MNQNNKLDKIQAKANKMFAESATHQSKSTRVGRNGYDLSTDKAIWNDIQSKLNFFSDFRNKKVLDIGCGCGHLAELCLEWAQQNSIHLSMLDIPEVITVLKSEFMNKIQNLNVNFFEGVFPTDMTPKLESINNFDLILLYSVLHYTSNPLELVNEAVKKLNSNGLLFIGDIPNINKRGRFRASTKGVEFEAKFQNTSTDNIEKFENQYDYFSKSKADTLLLNDSFINAVMSKFRYEGFDVYILPQPEQLPRSKGREDILIYKHD